MGDHHHAGYYIILVIIIVIIVALVIWVICRCNKCSCGCQCGNHKKGCPKHNQSNDPCSCGNEKSGKKKKKKSGQKKCNCDCECGNHRSGCPQRKPRSKCCCKPKCPKEYCGEQAYTSLNGTGVITVSPQDADLTVMQMTWNDPPRVQRPCSGWENVTTQLVPDAVVGKKAPKAGNYRVEYHVGIVSNGAIAVLTVNGQLLLRSASWTLDLFSDPELAHVGGRQLNKSFSVHLNKDDVVGILVFPFIIDGSFFIDTYNDTSLFRFLTTLDIQMIDSDRCNCKGGKCLNNADLVDGPFNGNDLVPPQAPVAGPNTNSGNTPPDLTASAAAAAGYTPVGNQLRLLGSDLRSGKITKDTDIGVVLQHLLYAH